MTNSSNINPKIRLRNGKTSQLLSVQDILYLRADHIYVEVYTTSGNRFVERSSLTDFMQRLPPGSFIQTHRSYAINLQQASRWLGAHVLVAGQAIPVSRSRRKVMAGLVGETAITAP